MIRVLVVDDDTEKLRRVVECLAAAGIPVEQIDECRDAYSAKRLLGSTSYDILVLDVVLPERIDQKPIQDGGIKLLREIDQRDKYRAPDHVVGLTAYPEVYSTAQERFLLRSWTVIRYDPSSNEWCQRLSAKAEQVVWARESARASTRDYGSQLAIVCALDDPELAAVRRLPWGWEKWREPGDPTVYLRGNYQADGCRCVVHAAASFGMGMTAAAVLATKMIYSFRPKYIASVGITAAFTGRANHGDVVSAEVTWDYSSGKFEVIDGVPRFSPAPDQHRLSSDLRGHVVELSREEAALQDLSNSWQGDRPSTRLRLLLGPVASGGAVVADEEKAREISTQHRKLLGVEMETYAV